MDCFQILIQIKVSSEKPWYTKLRKNKKEGEHMDNKHFDKVKAKHLKTLAQYVPIVARVHGKSHPEFYEVQKVFDALAKKLKGSKAAELDEEFEKLREITKGYTVPDDVCESYEAVYTMLAELDKAYHA